MMEPKIREDPFPMKESSFPPDFSHQPWLIESHATKKESLKFINPFDGSIETRRIPAMQGKLCLEYFEEWFLLLDISCNEIFLLNLNLDSKIHLPPMLEPFESLGGCVFTSSPTCPKCVLILVLQRQDSVLLCRPKDQHWTKVPCNFPKHNYFDGDIVMWKENLCALVANRHEDYMAFTSVDSLIEGTASWTFVHGDIYDHAYDNMMEDDIKREHGTITHLVVFNESVFLIVVHSFPRDLMEIGIFSLQNLEDGEWGWRREKGIDHSILFIDGGRNVSLARNHKTLQHDYIYVLISFDDEEEFLLYKINMDEQTFSFIPRPDITPKGQNNLCWAMPSRAQRINLETSKSSSIENDDEMDLLKVEENTSAISRQWADLPIEMVELLLKNLSLVDCIYIPTVCKDWSSVTITNHIQDANIWPWLMYCPKDSDQCRFIDPLYGKKYCMDLPFLGSEKAILHFSKDGWVLVSCGKNLFIINPFTKKTVKLPLYDIGHSLSFSSVPTSPDFIAFGIWDSLLYTWRPSKEKWDWITIPFDDDEHKFHYANNNPVFFRGEVYCLGRTGNLAVFNPETKKRRILDKPTPIHSEVPPINTENCYLMEIKGQLISVFQGIKNIGDIRVFQLDRFEMAWTELNDLGDLTLFIDRRNSIAKCAPLKGCANRIYFPRFDDNNKHGAYYSMETHKYYPKVYGPTEPLNCVWIEPNLNS